MFARLKFIRLTAIVGAIKAAGNEAFGVPVGPSGPGESAVATKTARKTTRQQILGTNMDLHIITRFGVDA
jgi:hypothetical protein